MLVTWRTHFQTLIALLQKGTPDTPQLHQQYVKGKGKDKCLGTCYSAAYMSKLEQQRFTISEVATDWHELMIPLRIMRPSIARDGEQLDPRCSTDIPLPQSAH